MASRPRRDIGLFQELLPVVLVVIGILGITAGIPWGWVTVICAVIILAGDAIERTLRSGNDS